MAGDATIREARDIISRWSSSDMLDRITSLPPIPQMSSASLAASGSSKTEADSNAGGRSAGGRASENSSASADSRQSSSGFAEERDSQQAFDDSDASDDSQDSHSILADLDKLARRANVKVSDSEDPSDAYLKLAEFERPKRQEATIDLSDLQLHDSAGDEQSVNELKERAPKSASASAVENLAAKNLAVQSEPDPRSSDPRSSEERSSEQQAIYSGTSQKPSGHVDPKHSAASISGQAETEVKQPVAAEPQPVVSQERETKRAAAPSLSSLLKQSNSVSVGQLAFKIDDQRNRKEKQESEQRQQQIVDRAAVVESLKSESSAQLRSGDKQTQNAIDSEGIAESEKGAVNLSDSDQADQNVTADEFCETRPEEVDANQPILPERASGDDQASTHPASVASERVAQPRKAQRRKHNPRNLKQAASDQDDDDQKGMNTVSRKYRVDNPNPESVEPAIAGDQQQAPAANSNSNSTGRRFRIDAAESMDGMLETGDKRVRTQGRSRQRYIDEPHANAIRGPHFEVVGKKRSNMASLTGQFLAYLGVLGLTVGTAIVIYGHFGGMSEYTPTGWLVTTVAQMMLFLGVINLVSGGIEQNNDDVSVRINTLGEQLMRIEQVTEQALRGPKIAASRYADPDSVTEETRERETVEINK